MLINVLVPKAYRPTGLEFLNKLIRQEPGTPSPPRLPWGLAHSSLGPHSHHLLLYLYPASPTLSGYFPKLGPAKVLRPTEASA